MICNRFYDERERRAGKQLLEPARDEELFSALLKAVGDDDDDTELRPTEAGGSRRP